MITFWKRSVCMTFSDYMDYLCGKRIGVIGFGVSKIGKAHV